MSQDERAHTSSGIERWIDMVIRAQIDEARDLFKARAWKSAHRELNACRKGGAITGEDLEHLAVCAHMLGRPDEALDLLEEAHLLHQEAESTEPAIRSAFWLGMLLLLRGDVARGSGWISRARRLLDGFGPPSAQSGYLLFPGIEQELSKGRGKSAFEMAATAFRIGEQFGDKDVMACARHLQGRALILEGDVSGGLSALDETMVMVDADDLSPLMTGLIYCSVIEVCQMIQAGVRAREWTDALSRWCAGQPDQVVFSRRCLIYRAEVMRLHGAWMDALKETQALFRRYSEGIDRTPPAAAYYEQGEIHRLRGEYDDAEQAYRSASLHGRDPQPGLALLRLSQGDARAALAGLRSALASASSDARRLRLLPALLECLLELRDYDEAGAVLDELDRLAGSRHNCTELLSALISKARGAFLLASGETHEALRLLREAWPIYRDVDVPYEAARVRELIGRACLRLSDDEGGELELAAALQEFERLGAAPDADRVFKLLGARAEESPHGLSERELEVLRMVAAGKTNRRIAEELSLSRRTIDRHVSNIFSKLDVASRTAAAAYAIRRRLV